MFCDCNTPKENRGAPPMKGLTVIMSLIWRAGPYFGFLMTLLHNADQKNEGDSQQNM